MKNTCSQPSPQISKMSLRCVLYIDPARLSLVWCLILSTESMVFKKWLIPILSFSMNCCNHPLESTYGVIVLSRASHADCTGLSRLYLRWCRYAKACHGQEKPEEMAKQRSTLWMVRLSKISMAVWRHKF